MSPLFIAGQNVICVDEHNSWFILPVENQLSYMQEYVVEACRENFVKLEGVKGEWHVSRFVGVE